MSRKKNHRRPGRDSALSSAAPMAGEPSQYFGGNYQGAAWTPDRGMLAWSTIDTREELSNFERGELLRRIHWLKAHFGFVRGLIKNAADLCGWQTPQAQSGDEAWDDLAEERFRDVCGEAAAFDVAGKFDFEDAQPMLLRAAFTDAQIFTVMTKWEGTGAARFAFYEASQLRNPKNAGKEWRDGIKVSKSGRHLAYAFADGEKGEVIEVPAASVIYFGEFDSPGQDAPVPPLAHAVNHSVDITEVWGFQKKATKVSSLSGVVIERDVTAQPPRSRQGIVGPKQEVTVDGKSFQSETVWGGGQIPSLEPGAKAKILSDDRPSAQQRQLILDLKRDISSGFGLPVEVIDEMFNLTGPGIRYIMDFAGNWIRCRQKRLRVWLRKVWRYTIACELAAGRLPLPKPAVKGGRGAWWAVSFTGQRLLTIDRGKESRARLDEIDAGVGTWAAWEELDGMDWKDRMKQRVREVKAAQDECAAQGVEFRDVYPVRQGAAAAPEEKGPPGKKLDTEDEE